MELVWNPGEIALAIYRLNKSKYPPNENADEQEEDIINQFTCQY